MRTAPSALPVALAFAAILLGAEFPRRASADEPVEFSGKRVRVVSTVLSNDCAKLATFCRKRITAMAMLLMVMPVSNSVNEERRRPRPATLITSKSVSPAPIIAASQTPGKWRQMANTAPSDAPLAMPRV